MKPSNRMTSAVVVCAASIAAAMLVLAPTTVSGQPPAPGAKAAPAGPVPRLANGKPDMNGFWGPVAPGGNIDIEPAATKGGAKGGPALIGGAPAVAPGGGPPAGVPPGGAAAAKGKAKGVIIDPEDARVPYTPAARAKSDDIIANRMFLEPELHCFMSGVPHNMWVQFNSQIAQTNDYVVFMWEFQHSRRIIPTDGRPLTFPANVRQFQGESSGKWEGDTLVIHTVNQTDRTWFDTSGHYAPKDIDVVERLTMINANQIQYEAVVTSPSEFTQPMRLAGMISRANQNDPTYEQMEFGCVEGNRDLEHYTQDKGGKAKNIGGAIQQ
jgi:hypothetical protein